MSLNFPYIYLLPTNLGPEEEHSLKESILPWLTCDAHKAEVVVGRITQRERALFELRRLKIKTKEIPASSRPTDDGDEQPSKRRRTSGPEPRSGGSARDQGRQQLSSGTVKVTRLSWLTDSLKQNIVLPTKGYLLYEGEKLPFTNGPNAQKPESTVEAPTSATTSPASSIWRRAAEENANRPIPGKLSVSPRGHHPKSHRPPLQLPALVHETSSDHDAPLPPVPDFLHTTYSCQRPTPVNTPNAVFIDQLKEIRTLRLLEGDQIAVRAYSTSIAALAAYPHRLQRSSGQFTQN